MKIHILVAALAVITIIALNAGHDVYALVAYGHVSPKLGWAALLLAPSALLLTTLSIVDAIIDWRQRQRGGTVR
jgi:hypothetical protein